MLNLIQKIDQQAILFFQENRQPWLDQSMLFITDKNNWTVVFILVLIVSLLKYKTRAALFFLYLAILVGIVDFTTAKVFKPFFARLRPCHTMDLDMLVGCGGKYGFFSNHAGNMFALFHFVALLVKKNLWLGLIYLIPVLVSLSRVYLGKHYLSDVLVGALYGLIWAHVARKIYLKRQNSKRENVGRVKIDRRK